MTDDEVIDDYAIALDNFLWQKHEGTVQEMEDAAGKLAAAREILRSRMGVAPPAIKVNAAGTVAVSQSVFWLPIDHEAPLGVRLLLINKDAGRATDGQLGSNEKFFDHYQAFPKFRD